MYFKLEYTIRELALPKDELLSFEVKSAPGVLVEIRAPNDDEQEAGHKVENAFCTSYLEMDPSDKNAEIFERIEKNQIPNPGDDGRLEYPGPNGQLIILPSIDSFPEHFRAFLNKIKDELSLSTRFVIDALRWRIHHLGPHQPISTRWQSWSRDKIFWHPIPPSFSMSLFLSATSSVSEEAKGDINALIANDIREPVHHELFREAWRQQGENPRSSLVIGLVFP